jgi:hypothetical protein
MGVIATKLDEVVAQLEDVVDAIGENSNFTKQPASHNYAAAHADWTLSDIEKKANVLVVTNASQAANIIAPSEYRKYILVNTSGYAITIKKTAGTGIAVANNKTAEVFYNGTDYARLTADI